MSHVNAKPLHQNGILLATLLQPGADVESSYLGNDSMVPNGAPFQHLASNFLLISCVCSETKQQWFDPIRLGHIWFS